MGSLLSTPSPPPAGQKRVFGTDVGPNSPSTVNTEPLFLDEVKAEPATWSEEGICRTIQRFLGLLPDSMGEVLKNQQQYPVFSQRSAGFVTHVDASSKYIQDIQQFYRRYRRLRIWHEVSDQMVQIVRGRLAAARAQELEKISAASFRLLLCEGFSASKVCISGALKTIQLRLVLNAEAGECYITWTPSRKKKPRINLHDVEQVIPVLKEGNHEAPRLSKKVSSRRGLIIVCKTYHRGRIVLEVATRRERNILLQGFQQLLSEMISSGPTLDDVGAIRNPRRQSAIDYFRSSEEPQPSVVASSVVLSSLSPRRGSVAFPSPPQGSSDSVRADAKAIEHFYQTRFDESPNTILPPSESSRRPSRAIEARH
ncbi:hypothetical protein V7S43_000812 [Phytophthora oleae]|uniref:Uncharacterized protein n=1 Tax=Phytophthora oleae TaxID=2107226 RepID=A0ABD3G862_9STRA